MHHEDFCAKKKKKEYNYFLKSFNRCIQSVYISCDLFLIICTRVLEIYVFVIYRSNVKNAYLLYEYIGVLGMMVKLIARLDLWYELCSIFPVSIDNYIILFSFTSKELAVKLYSPTIFCRIRVVNVFFRSSNVNYKNECNIRSVY